MRSKQCERQQMAEQAGEEFHGQPHDTRSRSEKDSTGTGQTDGGRQEFSPCRRGALHSASGCRARRAHCHRWPAGSVRDRNRRCLAARCYDHLAARLARDGDPEPIHIENTDTTFAIEWKGKFHIEGGTFVYVEGHSGRMTAIFGYPTRKLAQLG